MKRSARWATVAVLVILATASCHSKHATFGEPTRHFHSHGISFDYPARWQLERYEVVGSMSTSIAYLSDQALHEPCVQTSTPQRTTVDCGHAIDVLKPGGALLEWNEGNAPTPAVPNPNTRIAGHVARLEIKRPGDCARTWAADESLTASIRASHRISYDLLACLRGPDTITLERTVRTMLKTVSLG